MHSDIFYFVVFVFSGGVVSVSFFSIGYNPPHLFIYFTALSGCIPSLNSPEQSEGGSSHDRHPDVAPLSRSDHLLGLAVLMRL